MSLGVHLDDASIAAIARQVADLLGREIESPVFVKASEVSRRFGVSLDYVYRHADELGVIKLGDGPKPRLRFDPSVVAECLSGFQDVEIEKPQGAKMRAVRCARSIDLLPINGE